MKLSDKEQQMLQNMCMTSGRTMMVSNEPRHDLLARTIKRIKKKGRVLDIGFGDGYFLRRIYKEGYSSYGADISTSNVKFTQKEFKKQGLNIKLKHGKINELPFKDNFFDIIVASEVIEHTNVTELNEIRRCLKKGGYFIGTVPAEENLEENKCFCPNCNFVFHKFGHQQSFSQQKIKQLLKKSNLKAVLIKRKIIKNKNLNVFGKVEYILRKIINNFHPVGGANYLIIAKKIK
jgi:ubiquinone/menaquinone biosynthesis C-methylase UbiE